MKRVILFIVSAIAVVGIFDALANLPVVSGCAFYAECVGAEP